MPIKFQTTARPHARHRRVQLTFDFLWSNPNPLHVFDATDKDLERRYREMAIRNMNQIVWLDIEKSSGFIHKDFFGGGEITVKAKVRELGENGKPLNFFQRLRYLFTGRYWR